MMLLLFLGCYTRTESHCETEVRDVEDDEVLDLQTTVVDILGAIGPQRVDALDLSGATVALDVTVARGDGPAVLADTTAITEVVGGSGQNTADTWLGPGEGCQDTVQVPVALTIGGAGVAIDEEALLSNDANRERGWFEVLGALDVATDVVPAGRYGAPVSGEARVDYLDGALYELQLSVVTESGARETLFWYRD